MSDRGAYSPAQLSSAVVERLRDLEQSLSIELDRPIVLVAYERGSDGEETAEAFNEAVASLTTGKADTLEV